MKKRIGVVSYNIYCNFTNYGSALQSWALCRAIDKSAAGRFESVLVDYCPDILADKDPLDPIRNMWDKGEEAQDMVRRSLPAIRENYDKFNRFYNFRFQKTVKYTSVDFNCIVQKDRVSSFICGSDTIFCTDEFGFDDGYFANYDCMRGNSAAYAASFGDAEFDAKNEETLLRLLQNFKAIGLRENRMLEKVRSNVEVPVQRVIDPTLLLTSHEYDAIIDKHISCNEKYLLLYSRRYNPKMEQYAEQLAKENGWKVVEISLRATNEQKGHQMRYDAGVEEFLALVKNAEFVVTNSFHGGIFAIQFSRPFFIFSREQCDSKIEELLKLLGLQERLVVDRAPNKIAQINYSEVHERLGALRAQSMDFLNSELCLLDAGAKE